MNTFKTKPETQTKTYGPLPVSIRVQSESPGDVVLGQMRTGAIYLASLLAFLWWLLGQH